MSVVPVLAVPVAPAGIPVVMRVLPVGWGSVGHIGIPVLPGAGRLTCGDGHCRGDQGDDGECREGDATYMMLSLYPPHGSSGGGDQSTRAALNTRTTSRSSAVRLHELFVT